MKLWSFILLFLAFSANMTAQNKCNTAQFCSEIGHNHLDLQKQNKAAFEKWKKKHQNRKQQIEIIIPVHVVIVHPPGQAIGTDDNLSLERIESQIVVLNEDFGGTNVNFGSTPAVFNPTASDISFCLANVDPDGNPTDGVTRFATNLTYGDNYFDIMEQTIWDRDSYLNIYVASTMDDLGFSPVPQPGFNVPAQWDAVSCLTSAFGGPGFGTQPLYDLGKTATHEIGHWLGLSHVWGPGSGGCVEDDGIDDTPSQSEPNYGCPSHPLPDCGNPSTMFMSYMDYTDDICMTAFSAGQVDYMYFILETVREELIGASASKCDMEVEVTPIEVQVLSQTDVLCAGQSTGSVEVSATGGTPPYSYALNFGNLQTSPLFTNLTPGQYTIQVYDQSGMEASIDVTLAAPPNILIEVAGVTNPSCDADNGSFLVAATGGNPGLLTVLINGMSSPSNFFSNLSAGTYDILVEDSEACQYTENYVLNSDAGDLALEMIDINYPECSTDLNVVDVSLSANSTSGIAEYILNGASSVDGNYTTLSPGIYDYEIIDSNGCSLIGSFDIDDDWYFEIIIDYSNPSCFNSDDGVIEVFNTTGHEILVSIEGVGTSTGNYVNLSSGTYEVVISTPDLCFIDELAIELLAPPAIEVIEETISFNQDCSSPLYEVQFGAEGGAGLFEYSVNGVSNSSGLFSNLEPGTYTLEVLDYIGCQLDYSFELFSQEAISLVDQMTIYNDDCTNPLYSSQFTATGGSGTYVFTVNGMSNSDGYFENLPPGSYTLSITDEENCVFEFDFQHTDTEEIFLEETEISYNEDCDNPIYGLQFYAFGGTSELDYQLNGQTNQSGIFEDIGPGNYLLLISDDFNCQFEYELELTAPEPISLMEESLSFNNDCAAPVYEAQFQATGGEAPLTYTINGTSNQDGFFDGLLPGSYVLEIMGASNCQLQHTFVLASFGDPFDVSLVSDPVISLDCDQSVADIIIETSGGIPPYIYYVNGIVSDTPDFEDFGPGSYEIVVEDGSGCYEAQSVEVIITGGSALQVNAVQELLPDCNGAGELILEVEGGVMPYTLFVNGEPSDVLSFALDNGLYEYYVEDVEGCITPLETINVSGPEAIDLQIESISHVSCAGSDSGSVVLNTETNVGISSYNWEPAGTNFLALTAGNYAVTVTNTDGCTSSVAFEITEPDPISLASEVISAPTEQNPGMAEFEAIGGVSPYKYQVGAVENETGVFILQPGDYTLTITDANGCKILHEFIVLPPSSTADLFDELDIKLGPNPSQNTFQLSCQNFQEVNATIFDTHGRQVEAFALSKNVEIDATDWEAGLYFLVVKKENRRSVLRMIRI